MITPKKYDNASCCKQGNFLIYWMEPKFHKLRNETIPLKTGWTMSIDDEYEVNVNYCPFCGKKLSTLTE